MKTEFLNISQAQLKRFARLGDIKIRYEERIFLAEGIKVVEELLKSRWNIECLLVLPEKSRYWEKISSLIQSQTAIAVYELTRSQWQKIGQDKEPEGLMAVVALQTESTLNNRLGSLESNALILHEIGNPQNLGALMRSAQWFGFDSIILSANCVDYTHPKAVRASMGSLFHLNLVTNISLKKVLPEIKKSYYLVGSNVHRGLAPHLLRKRTALLLGSESHGLPDDLLAIVDEQWSIPGSGKVDSLSLPQAAAIMMYECVKR